MQIQESHNNRVIKILRYYNAVRKLEQFVLVLSSNNTS